MEPLARKRNSMSPAQATSWKKSAFLWFEATSASSQVSDPIDQKMLAENITSLSNSGCCSPSIARLCTIYSLCTSLHEVSSLHLRCMLMRNLKCVMVFLLYKGINNARQIRKKKSSCQLLLFSLCTQFSGIVSEFIVIYLSIFIHLRAMSDLPTIIFSQVGAVFSDSWPPFCLEPLYSCRFLGCWLLY